MQYPEQPGATDALAQAQELAAHSVVGLDAPTFYRLFPFHFALDGQCRVVQAGSALRRLLPAASIGASGPHVSSIMEVCVLAACVCVLHGGVRCALWRLKG